MQLQIPTVRPAHLTLNDLATRFDQLRYGIPEAADCRRKIPILRHLRLSHAALLRRRCKSRRVRPVVPPHTPSRSLFDTAHSRHANRTSHFMHTRIASKPELPFSGQNNSGSTSRHNAPKRQSSGSLTTLPPSVSDAHYAPTAARPYRADTAPRRGAHAAYSPPQFHAETTPARHTRNLYG